MCASDIQHGVTSTATSGAAEAVISNNMSCSNKSKLNTRQTEPVLGMLAYQQNNFIRYDLTNVMSEEVFVFQETHFYKSILIKAHQYQEQNHGVRRQVTLYFCNV